MYGLHDQLGVLISFQILRVKESTLLGPFSSKTVLEMSTNGRNNNINDIYALLTTCVVKIEDGRMLAKFFFEFLSTGMKSRSIKMQKKE